MSHFDLNSIATLQRLCQVQGLTPQYELVEVKGASHCPLFTVEVRLNKGGQRLVAIGQGGSKKLAKEVSARKMIKILEEGSSHPAPSRGYGHGQPDGVLDPGKSFISGGSKNFVVEEKLRQLEILKNWNN